MQTMAIRINPGNLRSSDAIAAWTERKVRTALRRFISRVTRVEVHFADLNGPKQGKMDLRCAMEARFNGRKPLAVEHRAEDLYAAIDGAARRLRAAMSRAVNRVNSRAQRIARTRAPGVESLALRATPSREPSRGTSSPRAHRGAGEAPE
ncbi:MAG TPA: HPF/RaiA family ribosome-associated protein [Phycisphaerales bacterium]|nr:HPF/RaiA family ribosome-associated protein [Phycisphaerales bacterium]